MTLMGMCFTGSPVRMRVLASRAISLNYKLASWDYVQTVVDRGLCCARGLEHWGTIAFTLELTSFHLPSTSCDQMLQQLSVDGIES